MDAATALSALKFVSFSVTAAASIWGLAKETTNKAADGKKRLTTSGYVAIAFTVGSAVIGTVSFALEGFLKEQAAISQRARDDAAKTQAALDARVATEKAAEKERKDELDKNLREQRAALRELELNQRLLLASQPLRVLEFSVDIENLPAAAAKVGIAGLQAVKDFEEGQADILKDVPGPAWREMERALIAKEVVYPILRTLVPPLDDRKKVSDDVVFLVDLDGTGSVLLPIGYAEQRGRGYLDSSRSLNTETDFDADGKDRAKALPRPGTCLRYTARFDAKVRRLTLSGSASADCLAAIVHRRKGEPITATLSGKPRMVIVRGGPDGLLIRPDDVTSKKAAVDLCWHAERERIGAVAMRISLTPNALPGLAVTSRNFSSHVHDLMLGGLTEEAIAHYGWCRAFL